MQEVLSGGSYYSQNELALYFGLARAEKVTSLEVRWPSSAIQEFKDIAVNQKLLITEGSSMWKRRP